MTGNNEASAIISTLNGSYSGWCNHELIWSLVKSSHNARQQSDDSLKRMGSLSPLSVESARSLSHGVTLKELKRTDVFTRAAETGFQGVVTSLLLVRDRQDRPEIATKLVMYGCHACGSR